ncbi:Frataxin homolog, mitochondrial OS=Schizosaccharomyces pombe (strain 972 / ATCC 24843) GN=SPCC1183,03c PE=3 SV=1 [Rhizoctonia solani AG-1 IB]|uniref:ferroxidase n=1 Tax=Thanatephorus cucumeris (strain AG1-IB / isolate 7/3/14) TaxID=1108050 RepID=A0A0B7FHT8_THACB|nr:Frataxin homolog, mitochondrial OS=Schizosaccharomyces pombe (strain 972 / ATCC 24843) GN=SPCC1183,03c PE=3 SV=1 [Rhizoctonia solani AG-1 IB]
MVLPNAYRKDGVGNDYSKRTITTYKQSDITMQEYHRVSDKTMEALLDTLENLLDEYTELPYEVDYSSGVLTLKLDDKGTYVINKQPPNKQIWLSSPRSGPKRYDLDTTHNEWFYHRDNSTMRSLLEEELSEVFGQPIELNAGE